MNNSFNQAQIKKAVQRTDHNFESRGEVVRTPSQLKKWRDEVKAHLKVK